MIEILKDKINFEILQIDNGTTEIIFRGEEKYSNIGIIINLNNEEKLNIDNITSITKNMNYKQLIDFLNKNNIKYNNIKFL